MATPTATATATATTTCTIENKHPILGPFDVLCGRDKQSYNNIGNHRFRIMINLSLPKYLKCTSRFDRGEMILTLTRELQESCSGFRFFKRTKGDGKSNDAATTLIELDHKQSREKIGHALRDAASQHNNMKSKQMIASSLTKERLPVTVLTSSNKRVVSELSDYENINNNNIHKIHHGPRRLSAGFFQEEELSRHGRAITNTTIPSFLYIERRQLNRHHHEYDNDNVFHHQQQQPQKTRHNFCSEERRTSCSSFLHFEPIEGDLITNTTVPSFRYIQRRQLNRHHHEYDNENVFHHHHHQPQKTQQNFCSKERRTSCSSFLQFEPIECDLLHVIDNNLIVGSQVRRKDEHFPFQQHIDFAAAF